MVAASIQVFASAAHGTAAPADRIAPASQGVLIAAMSVFHFAPGAQGPRRVDQPFFDLETDDGSYARLEEMISQRLNTNHKGGTTRISVINIDDGSSLQFKKLGKGRR